MLQILNPQIRKSNREIATFGTIVCRRLNPSGVGSQASFSQISHSRLPVAVRRLPVVVDTLSVPSGSTDGCGPGSQTRETTIPHFNKSARNRFNAHAG